MKWSVKDYFLKAGICHLATGDMVALARALESYRDLDPSFQSQREHLLLSDLMEAVEGGDQEVSHFPLPFSFSFPTLSPLPSSKIRQRKRLQQPEREQTQA